MKERATTRYPKGHTGELPALHMILFVMGEMLYAGKIFKDHEDEGVLGKAGCGLYLPL